MLKATFNKILTWLGVREQRVEHLLADFNSTIRNLEALAQKAVLKAAAKREQAERDATDQEAEIRGIQAHYAAKASATVSTIADLNDQAAKAQSVATKLSAIVA